MNDVSISVPEGAAATVLPVLANDDDPDGDSFDIVAKTNGAHGTVTITGGGTGLTYDPASLFYGTDTFTYRLRDSGGLEDTATVVVTVTRDKAAPIVIAPAQRFLGQTVGSTLRARMTWSATDTGSGIKNYTGPGQRERRYSTPRSPSRRRRGPSSTDPCPTASPTGSRAGRRSRREHQRLAL